MINRRFYNVSKDKKFLHKHGKRWVTVSMALLSLLGAGALAVDTTHADVKSAGNINTDQKVNASPKPINISHNTDMQKGYGDVDNDPNEMKTDLTDKISVNQHSQSSNTSMSPSVNNYRPQSNPANSHVSAGSEIQKPLFAKNSADVQSNPVSQVSNDDSVKHAKKLNSGVIQQAADEMHFHLLNHAYTRSIEVKDGFDDPFNDGLLPIVPFHNDSDVLPHYNGTTDVSKIPGIHAYLSSDGTLLDVSGDFSKYNVNKDSKIYGLDGQDNHLLSNVTILELSDAKNLSNCTNMFRNMSDLVDVYTTGNWDTHSVSNMSGMFESDPNLSDISPLSDWDTSNTKSIRGMFSGDSALTDLSPLSHWNTNNMSDMNSAFLGDTDLTTLVPIQNWNTGHVTNMADMFFNDSKIRDLSPLYNWNVGNVQDMSGLFFNLSNLDSLVPLTEWNTQNVKDMSYLFSGDGNISSVKPLYDWNTSNVNNMSGMFMEASGINDFSPISGWSTHRVKDMNAMFLSDAISDLKPLSKWDVSNASDMSRMFLNDFDLTDIHPLAYWNTGDASDLSSMFQDTGVSDVSPLANWDTSKVVKLNDLLAGTSEDDWSPIKDNWTFDRKPAVKNMLNNDNALLNQYPDGTWGFDSVEPQHYKALLNYVYNGKSVGQKLVKATRNGILTAQNHSTGLPKGYTLTDPTQKYTLNGGTYRINVEPLAIKDQQDELSQLLRSNSLDTINYIYDGQIVGSSQMIGKKGTDFTLGVSPNNLPSEYRVSDPGASINYDGQAHDVPVELNEAAPVTMALVNQTGTTIGFVTLKDLGLVGQKVNIAPQVSKMMPLGYSLPSSQPIYITLTNDSSIVINA